MQEIISIAKSINSVHLDRELMDVMEMNPTVTKTPSISRNQKSAKLASELMFMLDDRKIWKNTLSLTEKQRELLVQKLKEDKKNSKDVGTLSIASS